MIKHKPTLGMGAALLALGLAAGSGAASAQTLAHHGFGAALQGTVQNLGSSSFQLKTTAATPVTVTFNAQTRVEKAVAGTTADLTSTARVRLQLQAGTTTVTAITVEPARTKPAGTKPAGSTGSGSTPKHVHPHPAGGTTGAPKAPKNPTTGPRAFAGGQVVSLSGNVLTLSGRGGTAVKYTLASNVKITKIVAGTTKDLANGETVQVHAPAGGAAFEITILS